MYPNEPEKLPLPEETLDSYIKRLRLSCRMSQQELASKAGIHLQSLGKLERGTRQRLNHKTQVGLALALDIPSEYLEAVSRGRPVEALEIKRFCPHCWIPGTPPESTWILHRANYCLICGSPLQKSCIGCGEPLSSFKHKFCPNCGTPYKQ
jgi:transcriptional regulator with XRE-family HTH domain